jgi:Tfp pilus assembly protein PilX
MDALGIVLAIVVGLFSLAVISFIVFVGVHILKINRRIRRNQADFDRRFGKDWDRKPPRSYK